VERVGSSHLREGLVSVDSRRHTVRTTGRRTLDYDALVIALGAVQVPAFEHVLTFTGPGSAEAMHGVVQDLEAGYVHASPSWFRRASPGRCPLYELALQSAERAYETGASVEVSLVTPERSPLEAFGPEAGRRSGRAAGGRRRPVRFRRRAIVPQRGACASATATSGSKPTASSPRRCCAARGSTACPPIATGSCPPTNTAASSASRASMPRATSRASRSSRAASQRSRPTPRWRSSPRSRRGRRPPAVHARPARDAAHRPPAALHPLRHRARGRRGGGADPVLAARQDRGRFLSSFLGEEHPLPAGEGMPLHVELRDEATS
jgi:hypothetical protein